MGYNRFDLTDKVAIVAGGSGLIGSALVNALIQTGAKTINADIRSGDKWLNLSQAGSLDALLDEVGDVDIFINVTYPRDIKTHTEGWLTCTERVARHMMLRGGSIINFGSIYGVMAPDFALYNDVDMDVPGGWYALCKGGIIMMSKCLAAKYGKYGVRINCVSPGGVFNHQPNVFVNRYEKKVPLGRMAEPFDLVGPTLFLASDASQYVTGLNLCVDGGITL